MKTKLPRYCSYCGSRLSVATQIMNMRFDASTGKHKATLYRKMLGCAFWRFENQGRNPRPAVMYMGTDDSMHTFIKGRSKWTTREIYGRVTRGVSI